MDGGIGAAEAERWLMIAAELLAARNMHGARTFAIRARESEARYEGWRQVLAVSDTLLAGDSLVPDWYSVLHLARFTTDPGLIANQYRKLVLLLNPVRTRLAFADQALKLVCEAWSVLSNSSLKLLYDNDLHLTQLAQLPLTPNQPQPLSQQQQSPPSQIEEERPSLTEPTRPASASCAPEPETGPNRAPEPETGPNRAVESDTRPIGVAEPDPGVLSFWTACPYCYHLFEYPKMYEECALRCQNCRRAFHAAAIPCPPLADCKNPNFCSWGFFPLGISGNAKVPSNWSSISAMFACPLHADSNPAGDPSLPAVKKSRGRPRKNPYAPPQAYHDDSDVVIDISDLSDDSDYGKSKRGSTKKCKGHVGLPRKSGVVVVHGLSADPNENPVASSGKKQSDYAAMDLGKLDLNVEFSNDAEELGRSEGNGALHRDEDNIEGIGFFEGLDEFFSSLPILNVAGDDKVKAS